MTKFMFRADKLSTEREVKQKEDKNDGRLNPDVDIYEDLGVIKPFTALAGEQFRTFIGELSSATTINDSIRDAFKSLWYAACIDIGGLRNNIWNLKVGKFEIFENNGVRVQYEKTSAEHLDRYTDQGRANFVFKSQYGNILIRQHDRNRDVFLVYVSENMTQELLSILQNAEIEALELKKESKMNVRISSGGLNLGGNHIQEKYPTDDEFNSIFLGERRESIPMKRSLTTKRGNRR